MINPSDNTLETLIQEMLDEAAKKFARHEISKSQYSTECRSAIALQLSEESYAKYCFDAYKARKRVSLYPYLDSSESQHPLTKRNFVLAPWNKGGNRFWIVERY